MVNNTRVVEHDLVALAWCSCLAARQTEIKTLARTELSARLAEMAGGSGEPLANWFRMEQIWLDVQLAE